jgi:hypothetical protein
MKFFTHSNAELNSQWPIAESAGIQNNSNKTNIKDKTTTN